MHPFSLNSKI